MAKMDGMAPPLLTVAPDIPSTLDCPRPDWRIRGAWPKQWLLPPPPYGSARAVRLGQLPEECISAFISTHQQTAPTMKIIPNTRITRQGGHFAMRSTSQKECNKTHNLRDRVSGYTPGPHGGRADVRGMPDPPPPAVPAGRTGRIGPYPGNCTENLQ